MTHRPLASRVAGLAWLVVAFDAAKALLTQAGASGADAHPIPDGLARVAVLLVALGLAWRVGVQRRLWAARVGVAVGLMIAGYGILAPGLDQVRAFGDPRLLVLVAGLLIAGLNAAAARESDGASGSQRGPTAGQAEAMQGRMEAMADVDDSPITRRSRFGREIFHPD